MIAVRFNVTRHINIGLEHVSGQTNAPATNTLHTPHSTFLANCLHSALLSTLILIINELWRVDKFFVCTTVCTLHFFLHCLHYLHKLTYASITLVVPTGFCGIGRGLNVSEQSDIRPPYARSMLPWCCKCTQSPAMSVGNSADKIPLCLHAVTHW